MSHHKRGRPKNRRAGCLMCKPWKMNGGKRIERKKQDRVAEEKELQERREIGA